MFVPSNTKATTLTRRAFLLLSRDDDGRTKKRRLYAAKKQNVYGSILGEFPFIVFLGHFCLFETTLFFSPQKGENKHHKISFDVVARAS